MPYFLKWAKYSLIYRYALVRFNERFANEYTQEPAKIPEAWQKITEKDALNSLKEAFKQNKLENRFCES